MPSCAVGKVPLITFLCGVAKTASNVAQALRKRGAVECTDGRFVVDSLPPRLFLLETAVQ